MTDQKIEFNSPVSLRELVDSIDAKLKNKESYPPEFKGLYPTLIRDDESKQKVIFLHDGKPKAGDIAGMIYFQIAYKHDLEVPATPEDKSKEYLISSGTVTIAPELLQEVQREIGL